MPVTLIYSLSSLAVAVGGVKECGIFVNEITPVRICLEALPDWLSRGKSAPFVVTDVSRESMKVVQLIRLGCCYSEELTETTEEAIQEYKTKKTKEKTKRLANLGHLHWKNPHIEFARPTEQL